MLVRRLATRLRVLATAIPMLALGGTSTAPQMRSFSLDGPGLRRWAHARAPDVPVSPNATWPQRIDHKLGALARESSAPPNGGTPVAPDDALAGPLARLLAGAPSDAMIGVSVRDLHTGRELFQWKAEQRLNPASNHKLLTATAAIELLGADFRFETRVVRDGDTLYLVGGGDPTLQIDDLQALADTAVQQGLDGIARVVVDDSMFSPEAFGPGYDADGPGLSYMAPSGALSLQFNTVEVVVHSDRRGGVAVDVSPASDHVVVRSRAMPGRATNLRVATHFDGEHTVLTVRGTFDTRGRAQRIRRSVKDPAMFTGSTFARAIARRASTPRLPVSRGIAPSFAQEVAAHRSVPLRDVLADVLHFSNNFTSEQILRVLGHLYSGAPGDWVNGRAIVERFWVALGQDPRRLVFDNAAGLSERGRITPRALSELTRYWTAHPSARPLVEAMPIAGREGTLRGRLHRSGGRVRAKTGTLSEACALTGVITDDQGDPQVGFSILVNGPMGLHAARTLQDRLVMAMLDHVPG